MTVQRLLVISPVRNEAACIETLVRSVAAQERAPDLWLVVDDGSDDETLELLRAAAERLPFMRVGTAPSDEAGGDNEDRLARAAEARAFNWGLREAGSDEFTHIGKLDGDLELPPDYFARLLDEFRRDPSLGIAGGAFAELARGRWKRIEEPRYHVSGALKLYSRQCLDAVGPIREHLGWDTIDETYARMRGFRTRAFSELVARHHRPMGSVASRLRGRARYGQCAYAARYPVTWIALRSLKVAMLRPRGVSGAAFTWGYARASIRRAPRVEDDEFRVFVRRELRERLPGRAAVGLVPQPRS